MLIATRIKHSQKDITYATFKKFHEFYCLTHCLRLLNTTRDVLYGLYASDFLHQILVFEVVLCAGGRTGGSLTLGASAFCLSFSATIFFFSSIWWLTSGNIHTTPPGETCWLNGRFWGCPCTITLRLCLSPSLGRSPTAT